ncbi:MAG: hypothetical protein CM15mP25_2190 [Gammaproteobacteria bacterium]|nr:MAG: hypothetical protein CM15mP25_2190 [Gammaproteobacteria bacterium]
MISGLIAEGISPSQLRASDPSEAALSRLEAMGLSRLSTAPDKLFEDADLVVAAVKPVIPGADCYQRPAGTPHCTALYCGGHPDQLTPVSAWRGRRDHSLYAQYASHDWAGCKCAVRSKLG